MELNTELITEIFNVCIIPLLGILTTFISLLIKNKIAQIKSTTNDEKAHQYLGFLQETILSCLQATNQTYVDELKRNGRFDEEAHKIALEKTKSAVLNIVTDDVKKYTAVLVGDLEAYITEQIEANIKNYK
jgi:hypothetical protein